MRGAFRGRSACADNSHLFAAQFTICGSRESESYRRALGELARPSVGRRGEPIVRAIQTREGNLRASGSSREATWEYRSIVPPPGLRVFGRFVDVNTFIAVDWWPRSRPLDGYDKTPLKDQHSLEYQLAQISVEQFWQKHLAHVAPILGSSCSEYFSAKCFDAGAKW